MNFSEGWGGKHDSESGESEYKNMTSQEYENKINNESENESKDEVESMTVRVKNMTSQSMKILSPNVNRQFDW